MSSIGSIIECPQIQTDLINQFTQTNPLGARVKQGLGQFVQSDLNTQGFLQRALSPGRGKLGKVELLYTPQYSIDEVANTAVKNCVATDVDGMLSTEYDIDEDQGASISRLFKWKDLARMCKDNSLWFAERIQAMMDAAEEKLNYDIAIQAAGLYGAFGADELNVAANVKTIQTRKADGSYNIKGLEQITFAMTNAGYSGIGYVFGFGEIYNYMRALNAGCCANDGLDLGQYAAQNGVLYTPDRFIKDALTSGGVEGFLGMERGALQLLTYLEFEGAAAYDSNENKMVTMVNPKTGKSWDFIMNRDCGDVSVQIKKAYKVVALPADMYKTGSQFEDVNFVNAFKIVNP